MLLQIRAKEAIIGAQARILKIKAKEAITGAQARIHTFRIVKRQIAARLSKVIQGVIADNTRGTLRQVQVPPSQDMQMVVAAIPIMVHQVIFREQYRHSHSTLDRRGPAAVVVVEWPCNSRMEAKV